MRGRAFHVIEGLRALVGVQSRRSEKRGKEQGRKERKISKRGKPN